MPFRLIGTIILLILVTIFAGVNLDNKCDITFIFYTFEKVPVFMTVIVSFAIGVILMLPFTFGRKKKKPQKPAVQNQPKQDEEGSKTLFDFKIKREASDDAKNADDKKKKDKSKEGKKSLFSKSAKKDDESKAPPADSNTNSEAEKSTAEANSTVEPNISGF